MEELLEVFASGLLIQYPTEDGKATKEANDEQKAAFKEALRKHMDSASKHRDLGFVLTYDYHLGKIRGSGVHHPNETAVESANGYLSAVLHKLPKIPDGESYVFPIPTFVSFELRTGIGDDDRFKAFRVCPWIQQRL